MKSFNSKLDPDDNPFQGLESHMQQGCQGQRPLIFLHPTDYGANHTSPGMRNYTEEELKALEKRDFETRLFFTAQTYEGDSVWLRTHWTDNHKHKSTLNGVRDYFKTLHSTRNFTAAKAVLSEIFTMCLEMEKSNYYSFAITMASGLSNMGKNSSFQIHDAMIKSEDELALAQRKLCLGMHLIFKYIKTAKFLYSGKATSIYRLVHCNTVVTKKRKRGLLLIPLFTFLLQICLTVFVIMSLMFDERTNESTFFLCSLTNNEDCNLHRSIGNFLLAVVTFVYSSVVALPGILETSAAYKMYGKIGLIQMLDLIINTILPIVLLCAGFLLIYTSKKFIDAVLNTAALLFIPEIDDQLPSLLGYNQEIIVKNFLVKKLLQTYDHYCLMKDEDFNEEYISRVNDAIGVHFSDYYLTHWPEQGSSSDVSIHFQPHEVSTNIIGGISSHHVIPVTTVNENCLIRKITWSYTTGFEYTIKPRIASLRLEMMNGEITQINMKTVNTAVGVNDVNHQLEGAFIITGFQMSSTILRLRVCGSYNCADFMKAFEYYSLWDITPEAKKLLQYTSKKQDAKTERSTYGRSTVPKPSTDEYEATASNATFSRLALKSLLSGNF